MSMMKDLLLVVLLLGVVYPIVIFGLDFLPERARHGQAQKILDSIYPSGVRNELGKTWSSKVDNFDESNTDTYQQRFYVNDVYWQGTGPVFLYIGGEGTLNGPPGGYVSYLGKQYSALLISVEHRFYGESIPYGNATTENYRYLTVEQALADLAGFTAFYKSLVPQTADAKWVAFGGSYPGALSSWYRSAYPSLTVGSLSSSGVVNCIIDYQGFDMQISAAVGNECAGSIRRVQQAFKKTIEQPGSSGWQLAKDLFACEEDISQTDFYYMIADSWSMAVQYSSKLSLCSALAAVDENDSSPEQDMKAMQTFAAFSNNYWGKDFCSQGFYNTKALADPTRWDVNSRSWRYQTCAQVSYFNTAPVSGSLRDDSVNLNYHLTQCAQIFGKKMFPASAQMNAKFGGEFPKASKVFYTDFSDDPWQRASVTFPPSADQPYYLSTCEECGHCKDLSTPQQSDPAPLKASRAEFEKYLAQWL